MDLPDELAPYSDGFYQAAKHIGVYWWLWDIENQMLSLSPGCLELLGYTEEEFDPTVPTFERNMHPEDLKNNIRNFEKLLVGEIQLYEQEFRIMGKEGEWRWFYNRGNIIRRNDAGEPLLAGGITLDISNRFKYLLSRIEEKKTESQLAQEKLKQSEEQFRQIFEAADDRIGLFDIEGNVIYINKAFSETIGFSKEDFLALKDKERIHPDDARLMQNEIGRLKEGGVVINEYRTRHKDGHYISMSAKGVLIPREDEKDRVLLIIRDITRQKEVEGELTKARDKAEESDRLKSEFLANMSHEIRTPLNMIVGFSNLLSEPGISEASRLQYIDKVTRNSDLLLSIISDIIDLAKIDSGQMTIIPGRVKLSQLFIDLNEFGEAERRRLKKEDIRFESEFERDLGNSEMDVDVVRLTQVLQKLINNALKFTESGFVRFKARKTGNTHVLFSVEDSGIGIDKAHGELIFDHFRQVDGSKNRRYGGAGLGLSICRNLVSLIGGRLWFNSEQGKGSRFYVELPLLF